MSTTISGAAEDQAAGPGLETSGAWSRVSFGPPPAWVDTTPREQAVPAKEGDHVTYLTWERQLSVPDETSFHSTAIRLETAAAVQHQSQWRVNADLRAQRLILHWLRVRRGPQTFDHLRRDRIRLIQRETQLEHLVIDGQWTALVVLDDVRVGDVVEAAFSLIGANPIRPGGCEAFFMVPPTVVVGDYRLRIEFAKGHAAMGWLASKDAPERLEEELPSGRMRWTWAGRQPTPRSEEPNQPSTFLDYTWVQVSDLDLWPQLAAPIAASWHRIEPGADLLDLAGLPRPDVVNAEAVHRAVRHIQDEFRYLSVDLESGGWIPAPPHVVAKRRYGDCKDLVWLATCVLRTWGVTARPVLVGTGLRERVLELRPMALLFNHVVLEVELESTVRWFDLTMRHQGGDFVTQAMPWYGAGLSIDTGGKLLSQPGGRAPGVYAARETVELDTRRNEPSLVEVCVCVEGWNADHLRATLMARGMDEFAKERLALVRRRFGKAERIGTLEWRDDRARNVCELAEAFEVRDVLFPGEGNQRAVFDVPPNLLIQTMIVPEAKERRAPWDLPRSCELRHELCFKGRSMGALSRTRRRWICPEFTGTLEELHETGCWKKVMRLTIKADEVSVPRIAEFRRTLEEFLMATTWRLYLPWNESRPTRATKPGQLPAATAGMAAYVPPADLDDFDDANRGSAHLSAPAPASSGRWDNAWRVALPVLFMVAFAGSRTCTTTTLDSPRTYAPARSIAVPRRDLYVPPPEPQDPIAFFEARKKDHPALRPGPTIVGEVYARADQVDRLPVVISQTPPAYPPEQQAARVEGEAVIEFVVTPEGNPMEITVLRQTHSAFGRSAALAVSQWRFQPATKAGHPVNMKMQAPFTFKLTN